MIPLCTALHTAQRKSAGKAMRKCGEKDQIVVTGMTDWGFSCLILRLLMLQGTYNRRQQMKEKVCMHSNRCHKFLLRGT